MSTIFITDDKKYLINKKDDMNYMLMSEKVVAEGSEKKEFDESKPYITHKTCGYYSNVGGAMKEYIKRAPADDCVSVKQYIERMEALVSRIEVLFAK